MSSTQMRLYNTRTRQLETVKPRAENEEENLVKIYNCGPTVYSRQHIGNYRAFAEWDILHRSLLYLGYVVDRVVNLTDVGHMTADEDFGEDKMEKSATESGKKPLEIADEIIKTFMYDLSVLNILNPDGTNINPAIEPAVVGEHGWTRATQYVDQMIDLVQRMEKNGFTYETDRAVYYDVTKFPEYTSLSGQNLEDKQVGVRDEVEVDPNKKHPADFVLWMKLVGKYENHAMKWESPWGVGFPGWHIECSAMGHDALGEHIDIHTGGIEHIGVHHSNEIAQNVGAFGHDLVNMWVHNEWLVTKKGEKMAKSEGNIYTIPELEALGYDILDLRYYYLSVKYRKPLYFSLEGLDSARDARASLTHKVAELMKNADLTKLTDSEEILKDYHVKFSEALADDLNVPKGLAVVNELLKSTEEPLMVLRTLLSFDAVLGLDLIESGGVIKKQTEELPEEVVALLEARKAVRDGKDFAESDKLRDAMKELGYNVLDTADGQEVEKVS